MISADKILRRLTDWNYIRHAARYYPTKFRMSGNMARLRKYHAGRKMDFTSDRNVRLKNIVEYANRHCPYYHNLFSKAHVDVSDIVNQFDRIPLLDKGMIRENADAIVSTQLGRMKYGTRSGPVTYSMIISTPSRPL